MLDHQNKTYRSPLTFSPRRLHYRHHVHWQGTKTGKSELSDYFLFFPPPPVTLVFHFFLRVFGFTQLSQALSPLHFHCRPWTSQIFFQAWIWAQSFGEMNADSSLDWSRSRNIHTQETFRLTHGHLDLSILQKGVNLTAHSHLRCTAYRCPPGPLSLGHDTW